MTNSPVKQRTIEEIIKVMGEERFKVLFSFVFPLMAIYFCPSPIALGRVINSEKGFTYKEWVN